LALAPAVPARAGFVFTSFDVPGVPSGTFANGINNSGAIVGYYLDSAGTQHGFLRDPSGTITTIDVPGSTKTNTAGINAAGQIVGTFDDASARTASC
jgi:probable HAF family extracellular repeat protein